MKTATRCEPRTSSKILKLRKMNLDVLKVSNFLWVTITLGSHPYIYIDGLCKYGEYELESLGFIN